MTIIKTTAILIFSSMLFHACSSKKQVNITEVTGEVAKAERDFEKMAAEKGIAEAFWFFADSTAVIKRGQDSIIYGKQGIRNYYSAPYFQTATVKWSPDHVEVSPDGQLGWTYGYYTWQSKDSSGKTEEFKGVFHTVWKKQADGSWKYVWD